MKDGWKMVKFSEVAQVVGGSTPKTNVKSFWNGDNYWVTPAELKGEKYINKTERTITDEAISKTNLTLLPKGTVLLSSRAPIGKVCITNVPMFCNQGFKNIVCKDSLYNEFVYYYLLYSVPYLESLGTGATFKEISKRVVENVEIPLPPLEEQHRIVSILDASFEKIDALKKNAEENLKNAKALFQQVLAQELKPKEGWVEKRLDEIATFYNGKAHEQCIDENGKYILVNSKYISSNTTVGKRTNSQLFPLYKDDIVMVMSDVPNGKALAKCLIIPTDDTHSLNQRICVFRNSKINVKLLYYLINRNPYLLSFNNGENQTNLRKNDILKMRLSYPTNEAEVEFVLNRLDEQINLINELIKNKEQTIRECDALKQSILRQAFSGEL